MSRRITLITALIIGATGAACEPDTPSEEAADRIENVGDELKSATEDVGNEVEDACEELKEEAGAKDTDC